MIVSLPVTANNIITSLSYFVKDTLSLPRIQCIVLILKTHDRLLLALCAAKPPQIHSWWSFPNPWTFSSFTWKLWRKCAVIFLFWQPVSETPGETTFMQKYKICSQEARCKKHVQVRMMSKQHSVETETGIKQVQRKYKTVRIDKAWQT